MVALPQEPPGTAPRSSTKVALYDVVEAEAEAATASATVSARSATVTRFFIYPSLSLEVVASSVGWCLVRAGEIPGVVPYPGLP